MKKITKTISALLLSAVFLTFAACTPQAGSNSSSSASSETASQASTADSSVAVSSAAESESSAEPLEVKIGIVGESSDQWKPVIAALAKENINIELIKFADYTLPNQALADGEIDLNAFQHYAYLNNEIKDKGLELTVVGETVIAPLGVYSSKYKAISEIPEGATIAIPSDATNGGRALKLLEAQGLVTVNPDAGYVPTLADITENTKNISFYEVEAANIPALLPDVDAAVINGGHAVDNGLSPQTDAIGIETVSSDSDNPYINVIVARTADTDNAVYKRIVEAYQTDEVAQVIAEVYKGAYTPAWTVKEGE